MAKYKLNDIAPIQQGDVPKADEYWLLNLDMVESNTGKVIDYVYCDESEIGNSTVRFDTRNVLYSKLRPYLNKVVIPKKAGYATSEMLPMRPNPEIVTREYLTYYLRSPSFVSYINEKTSGAKMPRANSSDLKEYLIDCPEISVQERITAQFDKLISIIDARKTELEKLDELIKARFVEMFGDPVENPKGYRVDSLQALINAGDITYHLDGNHGGEYPRSEEFVTEGVPYIGANCISNGEIDFSLAKYLTEERAGRLRKGIAQDEDVLFAHNATVGPTVVLHTTEPKVILSTSLTAYRCNKESIMPEYLATYMKSDGFVMQYSSEMKQTTRNQVPITAQKKYLFLIPPMEEQRVFSEFVKQVNKSKVVVQKSLDETQKLFDSLMQEYFG